MRRAAKLLGLVWIWIPVFLLTYWGLAYVRTCIFTLSNITGPVTYQLPTKAGLLTISARAVQIELQPNLIHLNGVTVTKPDGDLLASVSSATLVNGIPESLVGPHKAVLATLLDVTGTIHRLKNGQLDFQEFLPERNQQPSDIPYSVRLVAGNLRPAKIHLIDYRGASPWQGDALLRTFQLQGVGQRFLASADAVISRVGAFTAEMRKDPNFGISVNGVAKSLDIASLSDHIISLPEASHAAFLRGFAARSLKVSGPVRVYVPLRGQAVFSADIEANAADVAYNGQPVATSAHFSGLLTYAGMKGVLAAKARGISATYKGGFSWNREASLGGSLSAIVTDGTLVPQLIRNCVPSSLSLTRATFNGWLSWSRAGNLLLTGLANSDSIRYREEQLLSPSGVLSVSPSQVAINLTSARWEGAPVHGALEYNPRNKSLEGLLVASNVPLAALAARTHMKSVSGRADVDALLSGTSDNPDVALRATGTAATRQQGRMFNLGDLVAVAGYSHDSLLLRRLTIKGPDGLATATGTWNRKTDAIDFDVVGSGVPLSLIGSDISGSAAFLGAIKGTAKVPFANGRLELYGVKYKDQEVPLAFADLAADTHHVQATSIQAFKDAAKASGQLTYNVKDQTLSGSANANDITLSALLGRQFAGTIDVPSVTIGGTLKNISVHGTLSGSNIVASRVKVDNVESQFSLTDGQVQLLDLVANIDKSRIQGNGLYSLETHNGRFAGSVDALNLQLLDPLFSPALGLQGSLSGSFSTDLAGGQVTGGQITGSLSGVSVNDLVLGDGSYAAKEAGSVWSGTVAVGDAQHYLKVTNGSYNPSTKAAHANFDAKNLSLHSIYEALSPYVASARDTPERKAAAFAILPNALAQQIESIAGNLSASAVISGNVEDPDLLVPSLETTSLSIGGQNSGSLSAALSRSAGVWNIKSLSWLGGPGNTSVKGTIAENGNTQLAGSIADLNAQWLSMFSAPIAKFAGQSNLTFSVSGPTKSPIVQTSLDYIEGIANAGNRRQLQVAATINDGQIKASGNYYYNGLSGSVSALVPISYHPLAVPKNEPISVDVSLPPHAIAELEPILPWLDTKRTNGTISGSVHLEGLAGKLAVTGQASLAAPVVAANGIDTMLTGMAGTANLDGRYLNLTINAAGSQGGSVSLVGGKYDLGNLADVMTESLDTLLSNSVAGTLNMDHMKLLQKGPTPVDTVVDGSLQVSGAARNPLIRGALAFLQGNLSVPSAPTNKDFDFHPPVNPSFDVTLSIPSDLNIKAGLGQFQLTGSGTVAGNLVLPHVDANLVVDKGAIQLPNARINIDPGGTIQLAYQSTPYGAPVERADVDMTGTTALTANPYGNVIQRYDIDLQVHGDLLSNSALQISAQSNPPDLTQDQILTMLGEGGLFLQQATNAVPYTPTQQLQNAFYGAFPLLMNPVTNRLANGLGLDYLNLQYNQFEGVSIVGAKSLSKRLVLSADREISQPLPGQPLDFDLRLSYRVPLKGKSARNLNLFVETTEYYEYRVAIEYGFRF